MERPENLGIATGAFIEEREDWDAAVARAIGEGWRVLELTAITEDRFDALLAFLELRSSALDVFERVSIHAPSILRTSAQEVITTLAALPREFDIVIHPDTYQGQESLVSLGQRLTFENMDNQKSFGRTVSDLRLAFDPHPKAGFCLDVAHCWTNDSSLRLAHDFLDSFGDRLRQLHVSGIEEDGTHRPTTGADLDLYATVLARCKGVPWVLETELV